MKDVALLLFDLGKVVIDLEYDAPPRMWSNFAGISPDELRRLFVWDEMYRNFERGRVKSSAYWEHNNQSLGIDLSYEQFVRGWNAIFKGEHPEVVAAIRGLRNRMRVAALSNTNEVHVEEFTHHYSDLMSLFDDVFFSSDIGLRKPDEECFRYVLTSCEVEPHKVLFFDDNQENVDAARGLGIQSVLVTGPADVTDSLQLFG